MLFSKVLGQEMLKQKLVSSVKTGRIPHAQLFYGPEGSGPLALAIAYAQFVACVGERTNDSCGTCSSCVKFAKLAHPDLHFSFPVNTTKRVSKDPVSDDFIAEWRQWVISNSYFRPAGWYNFIELENKQGLINKKEGDSIVRKLSLKPFESDYKFMIIWLPEKMHVSTANMLLKLIEEPPEKTIFLLVSEAPDKLMATISSRTQAVKLEPVPTVTIEKHLIGRNELSASQAKNVARLADGNFIKALEITNSSEENVLYLEKFAEIMRLCWQRDYFKVNDWVDEMSGIGREKQKSFFEYAIRMVRENLMSNLNTPELVYLTDEENDFAKKFHPYINGNNVLQLYEEFSKASSDIERNAYAKIVLFDLALHIMKLIRK